MDLVADRAAGAVQAGAGKRNSLSGVGAIMETKLEELVSGLKEAAGKNLESVGPLWIQPQVAREPAGEHRI